MATQGGTINETHSFSPTYPLKDFAPFTRTFALSTDIGSCTAQVPVVLSDVSPFLTVLGGLGIAISFVAIMLLAQMLFRRRRLSSSGEYARLRRVVAAVGGALLGAVAAAAQAVWMQEAGSLSALDHRSVLFPIVGALVGAAIGFLGGRRLSPAEQPALVPPEDYEVVGSLGRGATGEVFLARELPSQRLVAIKVLIKKLVKDKDFLRRFRAEADIMQRLDHPNCLRFYRYFEPDGRPTLVTEYVEGASLQAVLDRSGKLTAEQALGVIRGSLLGLGHAHGLGLVHTDVKPANVLVDGAGISKLIDFGLARAAGKRPLDDAISGTPNYMSPEMVTGGDIDARSDLYSAGVMLYRALTGELPFSGKDARKIMAAHVKQEPPDPSTRVADLPRPVADLVLSAMAKDPAGRPGTAADFVSRLEAAARQGYGPRWLSRSSIAAAVGAVGALGAAGTAAAAAAGVAAGAGTAASVAATSAGVESIATAAAAGGGAAAGASGAGGAAAAAPAADGVGIAAHAGLLPRIPSLAQLGAGAAIAAVVTAVLPVLPPQPPPQSDIITVTQADQLFHDTWGTVADHSISPIIVGEARDVLRGLVTTTAGTNTTPRHPSLGLTSSSVFVRHQKTYPAEFIAYGSVDDSDPGTAGDLQSFQVFAIFRRTAEGQPWQMIYAGDSGSQVPHISVAPDGYVQDVGGDLLVDPKALAPAYARYLDAFTHGGKPPAEPPFLNPSLAEALKQTIADDIAGKNRPPGSLPAKVLGFGFVPLPDLDVYPLDGGGAAVFFVDQGTLSLVNNFNGGPCYLANGSGDWIFYDFPGGVLPSGQLRSSKEYETISIAAIDPVKSAASAGGSPTAIASPSTLPSPPSPLQAGGVSIVTWGYQLVKVDATPC